MLMRNTKRQAGVTLIEMMVGIVVGLVVLWGLSTVYINSSRGSRTTTSANALNQDMRAVMDIMISDLRRAGYWDTNVEGVNPFTVVGTTDIAINGAGDCVLYSYDARHRSMPGGYTNVAGAADAGTDFFGFRRSVTNSIGAIQTLAPTSTLASTAVGTCGNAASGAGWENLTDERVLNITGLTLSLAGSQCMAYVKSSYNPTDPTTFWASNSGCSPAPAGAPANAALVETRQITITLSASSLTDPTLAARTLVDTVLVRNNRTVPSP